MLPDGASSFIRTCVDISDCSLGLLSNNPKRLTPEELLKFKETLEDRYALWKTNIEHSMLSYTRITQDHTDLLDSLSDTYISKRLEELTTSLFTAKKKINELLKKKGEIEDVNQAIRAFHGIGRLELTQLELKELFGESYEKVMESKFVTRKHNSRDSNEGGTEGSEGATDNGKDTQETTYTFNAYLTRPIDELLTIQRTLQKSIDEYSKEIEAIKREYMDKVDKFEQIKRILGVDDKDEKENEDEDEMESIEDALEEPLERMDEDHEDHEDHDEEDHSESEGLYEN
jgi:prefoldin subunit 5